MKTNKRSSKIKSIKIDILQLSLNEIATHPHLEKIIALQSNFEYLMTNSRMMDPEAVKIYMALYPIFVVEENKAYFAINNVRVLQLAKIYDFDELKFNCYLVSGLSDEGIAQMASIDFYLNHLLFSFRSHDAADQICRLFNELGDLKKVISPEMRHLKNLADELGVDRRTVYLKRKKASHKASNVTKPMMKRIEPSAISEHHNDADNL